MRIFFCTVSLLVLGTVYALAAETTSTGQYLLNFRVLNGSDAVMEGTVAVLANNEAYLNCTPNVGMDLSYGYYVRIMPGGIEAPRNPANTDPGAWQNLPQRITCKASQYECCGVKFVVYAREGTQFEVVVSKLPPVTLVDGKSLPAPEGQDNTPVELGRLSAPMG